MARDEYEFTIELAHIAEAADHVCADISRIMPLARKYRRMTLTRLIYLVPLLVLAGVGVLSLWDEAEPVALPLGLALGAGAAGLYLAVHASLRPYIKHVRQEQRNTYIQSMAGSVGEWAVRITDEGVEFRSRDRIEIYPWRAIESIEAGEGGGGIQINVVNIGRAGIPMRAFADEAERDALLAHLRELRAAHPPPRSEHLGRFLAKSGIRCAHCGYDLGGCEQTACPECAFPVPASIATHFYVPEKLSPSDMQLAHDVHRS
jgi:hypothetical protein